MEREDIQDYIDNIPLFSSLLLTHRHGMATSGKRQRQKEKKKSKGVEEEKGTCSRRELRPDQERQQKSKQAGVTLHNNCRLQKHNTYNMAPNAEDKRIKDKG